MHLSNLATLLATTTLATAAVLTPSVRVKEQSCIATDFLSVVSYQIWIGIGYQNGKGCNDVHNAINGAFPGDKDYGNFFCLPRENGAVTYLTFQGGRGHGGRINAALHRMYPTVNGFNCPDY